MVLCEKLPLKPNNLLTFVFKVMLRGVSFSIIFYIYSVFSTDKEKNSLVDENRKLHAELQRLKMSR